MTVALRKRTGASEIRGTARRPKQNSIPSTGSSLKNEARRRLESFRHLVTGWDGYHAKAIDSEVIKRAATLLDCIQAVPEVFPTPDGNIQFQFEDEDANYLEIELRSDGMAEFYADLTDMEEERVIDLQDVGERSHLLRLVSRFA
ncbi:MAG: hypothetical protein IJT82_07930 [Schwartzia sp.]|nr:hypothetical protein [Schwartzia sp. (in: firmicutes)]